MGSSVPCSHFSTRGLPEVDRFDAWRDKVSVIFDVTRIGGPPSTSFEARVDAFQIGNLVITDSKQGEQAYQNTPKRIRRAGIDLIQIGFYRSGGYDGDASGLTIRGRPGDIQIIDLGRPIVTVESASDMVCVFIPREILQARIGDLDGLHGACLDPPDTRLIADYLALLAGQLPYMRDEDGETAANATLDLISACLRTTASLRHEAQSPIRQVMLGRAKQIIDANLRSPRLTTDFVCRASSVSRRSLYRLFEPLGGIHSYILRQRLARIMGAMKDPTNQSRISDLAADFGFNCEETFWRAFKRHYGMTPGDARHLHSTHTHPQGEFNDWLRRLV